MLLPKFLFYFSLIFLIEQCCGNSCREKHEISVICNSFSDLNDYPNPEKKNFIQITLPKANRTAFSCNAGMFAKFTAVKYFNLSDIAVGSIDEDCFKGMDELKVIDLSHNVLTQIDMKAFRSSEKVEVRKIFLENNRILEINLNSVVLPQLQTLNLKNNSLTSFYLKTQFLPNILHLKLEGNDIWRFEIESETLTNLDLSHNCIRNFMKDHLNLPNLKHLNLAGNHLTTVNTDMFANMPKLQYLYLAQNILDTVSLPNSHLVHVDLNNNLLKFMDNIAVNFVNHSSLHMSFNKFFEITSPSSFGNHPSRSFGQLTELVCNFCNIHLIMPYFIYDISPTMESLSLRSNLLRSVGFFNSRQGDLNLISIDLTYNNIRHIDRTDFAKLSKVINLYLGSNEIASIAPGAFERMAMLHILDLSNNFIFELPPNGFDRVPLVWLLLNGNNMAFFPIPGWQNVSMKISENNSKLNSLQLLNIENNPFQCDCLESIHMWARDNSIELKVYDTKVKAGVKPACIVNDQGCETNVGKDFIRGYWHLFNDNKIKDIIQLEDE